MSSISEFFTKRLNEITAELSGKNIIFFKGFELAQIKQLISDKNSILNDDTLINDNHLDFKFLNDKSLDIILSIVSAQETLVGFYEELLVISPMLSKVKVDKIIIVENNILSPWTPCSYPYAIAEALFDYLQSERETPESDLPADFTNLYGDVKLLKDSKALLLPKSIEDPRIVIIPFWQGDVEAQHLSKDNNLEHIEVGSLRDWEYCLEITKGTFTPALLLQNGKNISPHVHAVLCASNHLGVNIYVDEITRYQEKIQYDDSQFVNILMQYWGTSASFRNLLFYKDPDRSNETENITQGQIIAEIVSQCELAHSNKDFSNIFITSPTGAGKSILFQIPAIYLAEKYNQVTVVVSPLIALMNDQVDQLQRKRGISIAACINSSMTLDERSEVIKEVHSGKISLLYLAPELLLTTHLPSFLGNRKIGLMVIDEAHTVTSWGRDFRSDYWFLGDFLKKINREGYIFPVLCLTATAVYSGEDDVVNDTIQELGLDKTILHLGNVKRNNISFDIQLHSKEDLNQKVEDAKFDLTIKRVKEYVDKGEKVLSYFPYRSHVEQIYNKLNISEHIKIRRYHGQLTSNERKLVEHDYKEGKAMGLFCTKAFGMGIDVDDIMHIVHFAPTGTLADYVQEIGRAARNNNIHGIAHIDYFRGDLRYVRSLNGISEMRQYQLHEMLKKIVSIQKAKKRRNLLIAAETFEYLFKEQDVENKTKSGLMLISKDLINKYDFPVLVVRPKVMLSKNYINVPHEIERIFLKRYGNYCHLQQLKTIRTVSSNNQKLGSNLTVYSTGNTYLVDMAGIWENYFPDLSFGMFKNEFFERGIKVGNQVYNITPRVRIEIRYSDDYNAISRRLETVLYAITQVFRIHKNGIDKQFSQSQFEDELFALLGEKIIPHNKISMLLNIFTEDVNVNAIYTQSRSRVHVLRSRKMPDLDETGFFVSSMAFSTLPNYFIQQFRQCAVNTNENSFFRFYPLVRNKSIEIMPLLRLLELLGLASYEIRGGEKAEVFVRVNDPVKLQTLASSKKYTNEVLQSIQIRHRNNSKLVASFFETQLSDEERWELIEQYFLGNEEYVRRVLNLSD